jgi:hypothetical protein
MIVYWQNAMKCQGTTKKNAPCKKNVKDGAPFCNWHKPKDEGPLEECPVCYETKSFMKFGCNHGMCIECHTKWTMGKIEPSCPICRAPITTSSSQVAPESQTEDYNTMEELLSVLIIYQDLINYIEMLEIPNR